MAILDPLDVLVQLLLVLQRDGRQERLELAAILELADRWLAAASQYQRDHQEPGRSESAAARVGAEDFACVRGSVGVGTDHLPVAPAAHGRPGQQVDRLLDEPDRAVAHQHIGPAGVQRVHLVGVAERAVGRMDDDRVLVERRAAVGREDGVGVVVVDAESARSQAGEGVVGESAGSPG